MATKKLIVVIGATGKQGKATVQALLEDDQFIVRGVTRNAKSDAVKKLNEGLSKPIEWVTGTLDDVESLKAAFAGAYGVFYPTVSYDYGGKNYLQQELTQTTNLLDAVNKSGVSQLVFSGIGSPHRAPELVHFKSKVALEALIEENGPKQWTILRPVAFMDSLAEFPPARGSFNFFLPTEVRLQMIATEDIGRFASLAFQQPQDYQHLKLEIAGDEINGRELAALLTRLNGNKFTASHFPSLWMIRLFSKEMHGMVKFFIEKGYEADLADLRRRNDKLMNLEAWMLSRGWDKKDFGKPRGWSQWLLGLGLAGAAVGAAYYWLFVSA